MKFTLSWLKTHLETDAPLAVVVDKLSMIGLEVEEVEDRAAALAPFTVGYVKEARPHPDADRLKVCIVETGAGEVQVVCGGPNARTGSSPSARSACPTSTRASSSWTTTQPSASPSPSYSASTTR
jgi:predicted RNA-binding protein with EMAP domain